MSTSKIIDADAFAVNVQEIFGTIDRRLTADLDEPVKQACKSAKKVASKPSNPPYVDKETRKGEYRKGFAYKVDRRGRYEAFGYVGNRLKPGLVHLLEKGHAMMNGGRARTRKFVHMETAAKEGEAVLIREAGHLVDRALK